MTKFDGGKAWTDVAAMIRGHAELLGLIGGLFIMLPSLATELFIPFAPTGKTIAAVVTEQLAYTEAHMLPLLLGLIVATFGQATILALLLDPAKPTVGQSLRIALVHALWLLLANMIVSLVVGAGLTAFIVPGLYLFGRLVPVPAIMFGERRTNPVDLFRRSFALTAGNSWRIALYFVVVWLTAKIVLAAIVSVTGIAASVSGDAVALFLRGLVSAVLDAGFAILLLLTYVSVYRQLAAR